MGITYENLDVRSILEKFNVRNIKEIGEEVNFSCPFPEHKRGDQKPSSYINKKSGRYNCFGCHRNGSIVTFIAEYEGVGHATAFKWLRKSYGKNIHLPQNSQSLVEQLQRLVSPKERKPKNDVIAKETLNLFRVDWKGFIESTSTNKHLSYPIKRGLSLESLERFGIGFDKRSKRITIPVYNLDNALVGYQGRSTINQIPKYYPIGDKDKPLYGFKSYKKGDYVFGLNSADEDLIICEGELDAIMLRQKGFEGSVATSGSNITQAQIKQMKRNSVSATIFFDPDEAGMKGGIKLLQELSPFIQTKISRLPDNTDPAIMSAEQIKQCLEQAKTQIQLKLT